MTSSSLGITHTGEILVVEAKSWRLTWRGDSLGLPSVLDATLSGSPIPSLESGDSGCRVEFTTRGPGSYARDGEIAPWPMSSYKMVLGFAPMVREVVRTGRVPPWGADPAIGSFANDRSLTVDQERDLLRWMEAGSPRGGGRDPLKHFDSQREKWEPGELDVTSKYQASRYRRPELCTTGISMFGVHLDEGPQTACA